MRQETGIENLGFTTQAQCSPRSAYFAKYDFSHIITTFRLEFYPAFRINARKKWWCLSLRRKEEDERGNRRLRAVGRERYNIFASARSIHWNKHCLGTCKIQCTWH